jgi:hypothetical protein
MNFFSYVLMHFRMGFWGFMLILIVLILQTLMILGFKKIYPKDNDEYNEVSLNILQVIGTIYAILVGLLTYQVLNNFQVIQATISQEAIEIGNISSHVDAGISNQAQSQQIQKHIYAYLNYIIDRELSLQQMNPEGIHKQQFIGWSLLEKIANDLTKLDASEMIKSKILDNLNSLYDARRQRINYRDLALPNVIWQIFSVSIFFMMVNIAIVCCRNTTLKIFTSYLYVMSLILIFIIVIDLDNPFYGTVNVNAFDYSEVRDSMIALHGLEYLNS